MHDEVEWYADALPNYASAELLDHDIECGRHSGIPECCIQFFATKWRPVKLGCEEWEKHWKKIPAPAEYITCPSCTEAGRWVEIKDCNCWMGW
jgi:hypothetical protein